MKVIFLAQTNNEMADESDRKYAPGPDPGPMYQYGTLLDMAVRFVRNDFLPQLADGNETGIVTVEGKGSTLWNLTTDNENPTGAFQVMLRDFMRVGAASGSGSNYVSGFDTALKEFKVDDELDKVQGDKSERIRFIVAFLNGSFLCDENKQCDQKELMKTMASLVEEKVHLLIIGLGVLDPVNVPVYDPTTNQRKGSFESQARYQPEILQEMQKAVPGSDLIWAPPGTKHIQYSFPKKSSGLYAKPTQSNLAPWLLMLAMLLLVNITIGGGGRANWRRLVSGRRRSSSSRAQLHSSRLPGLARFNIDSERDRHA